MDPLPPGWRLFDRPGKLLRNEARKGASRRDGPDLMACDAERLTTRGMV